MKLPIFTKMIVERHDVILVHHPHKDQILVGRTVDLRDANGLTAKINHIAAHHIPIIIF